VTPLRVKDATLRARLKNTINECRHIWETQVLAHYTRHGVDHSERIAARLAEIIPAGLLTDVEIYILLQSVYLHDIGMQDITYALPHKNRATLNQADGDYEAIRRKHHLASKEWIEQDSRGVGSRHTLKLRDDPYADLIALVCRHHTDSDLSDLKGSEDIHRRGQVIRVLLLAALLTIGDELDLTAERVDMDLLTSQPIPAESKEHWWKHHYVETCRIVDQHVEIVMEAPAIYRGVPARALARSTTRALRKQLAKPLLHRALSGARIDLTVDDPRITYDETGLKKLLPPEVHVTATEVLREDDIDALSAYSEDDVTPNPGAHFYGFNPLEMTAPELKELHDLYSSVLGITGKLGGLRLAIVKRQLNEKVQFLLVESPLNPEARLFLHSKAYLTVVAYLAEKVPTLPGEAATGPGDVTDEFVWEDFRQGDARFFCPEPGAYERWRGSAEMSLGQHPDLVAKVEAVSRELGERLTIMVLATNTLSFLSDPGTMWASLSWLTQLEPEVRAELDELHLKAQQPPSVTPTVPPGTLIVTVVADGQPVVGQKVDINTVEERPVTLIEGPTDTHGQIAANLPGDARYQVGVQVPSGMSPEPLHGVHPCSVSIDVPSGGTATLTITLHRITGRVVGERGQPLAGAYVRLNTCARLLFGGPFYGPYAVYTWTMAGADGTFSLIGAEGTWDLECSYSGNVWHNEITVGVELLQLGDITLAIR